MTLTVAGCQLACHLDSVSTRVARMERLAREARERVPDLHLIAFPELALSGYRLDAVLADLAEPWPEGPSLLRLSALAKELELVVVVGFPELDASSGALFNSAAVFDMDGSPLGVYRKTHCLEKERQVFRQGADLPVWRTQIGKFGLLICWDAAIPEAARALALQDPDFLLVLAAWEDPYLPDWRLVMQARAFDNVLPVLGVNSTGRDDNASFSGGSCAVDCLGRCLAEAGTDEDEVIITEINMAHTRRVRSGYGSQLRDRRPDLYSALSDESAAFLDASRHWAPR